MRLHNWKIYFKNRKFYHRNYVSFVSFNIKISCQNNVINTSPYTENYLKGVFMAKVSLHTSYTEKVSGLKPSLTVLRCFGANILVSKINSSVSDAPKIKRSYEWHRLKARLRNFLSRPATSKWYQ